jgi:hypothetical protein
MEINRKCGCGKIHKNIPENARKQLSYEGDTVVGFHWECECGNTLYVPTFTLKNLIHKEAI